MLVFLSWNYDIHINENILEENYSDFLHDRNFIDGVDCISDLLPIFIIRSVYDLCDLGEKNPIYKARLAARV